MAKRINYVCAIIGQRGSGKTDYLKGNATHGIKGVMNIYPKKGMKVLIIDTFDHPSYKDIPILPMNKFQSFTSGIYRVFCPNPDDVYKLNDLLSKSKVTYNTCLVYEDAFKHTSVKVDKSLMRLMIDSKQKNIDIIFMYHAFMQAPTDLYRFLDFIELFKTRDTPDSRKTFMQGYYNEAIKIYNEVKNHKSPYYHKLIDAGH